MLHSKDEKRCGWPFVFEHLDRIKKYIELESKDLPDNNTPNEDETDRKDPLRLSPEKRRPTILIPVNESVVSDYNYKQITQGLWLKNFSKDLDFRTAKDPSDLLQMRLYTTQIHQKTAKELLNNRARLSDEVLNQLLLGINILYELSLIEDFECFFGKSRNRWENEQSSRDFKENKALIERNKAAVEGVIDSLQKKLRGSEIRDNNEKKYMLRFLQLLTDKTSRDIDKKEITIEWLVEIAQKNLRPVVNIIKAEEKDSLRPNDKMIEYKEAMAFFYLIVSIELNSFFIKPENLSEKFYDPLKFREFVNDQSRKNLLKYIVLWFSPV